MKKEYLVIVENCDGKFYLNKKMEFTDAFDDSCVWDLDKELINTIVSEDAKDESNLHYTFKIEEIEEIEE